MCSSGRKNPRQTRNNFELARLFEWWRQPGGNGLRRINRLLGRCRIPFVLQGRLDPSRDMTSLEQRMNLWMLAEQAAGYGVPGEFAEFGCFDGRTATLFAQVLRDFAPDRRLHLYDRFDVKFHLGERDIEREVLRNFEVAACPRPVIHRGDFEQTIPADLPDCIAFAHIDCGFGGDPEEHRRMVLFLLEHIHPRLRTGSIVVVMDYRDPELALVEECNPGSRLAVDAFLADKPERLTALYAGEACHAFFRKM